MWKLSNVSVENQSWDEEMSRDEWELSFLERRQKDSGENGQEAAQ